NNARGAGVHEAARHAQKPFTADLLAQPCLTGAEHHRVDWQVQVVDVLQGKKAFDRLALLVEQGKEQPREVRVLVIDQAMRSKMDQLIAAQIRVQRLGPRGIEV